MNEHFDISIFLDSPEKLLQLCRQVVEELDQRRKSLEYNEREAQLKEIALTIAKLDKSGVPIPDELRSLKTGLVSELAVRDEVSHMLNDLADGFEEILLDLNSMIGAKSKNTSKKPSRKRLSKVPKTNKKTLRTEIINALKALGGRAHVHQVLSAMEKKIEGRLLQRDLETTSRGDLWYGKTTPAGSASIWFKTVFF